MKTITFEKIIQTKIDNILDIISDISPYKKKAVVRNLKQMTDIINDVIHKKKENVHSNYDYVLSKAIDILILHGYTEDSFLYYKENFLKWFMKKGVLDNRYKSTKITKEIIDKMMSDFYLFQIEKEIEPENYEELRNYILKNDRN